MSILTGLWVAGVTVVPLARHTPPDPADVKSGWVGFAVFIGLLVAVVLLWLSFRKQLGKIDFEEKPEDSADRSSERHVRGRG
jgi:hypothetical protein